MILILLHGIQKEYFYFEEPNFFSKNTMADSMDMGIERGGNPAPAPQRDWWVINHLFSRAAYSAYLFISIESLSVLAINNCHNQINGNVNVRRSKGKCTKKFNVCGNSFDSFSKKCCDTGGRSSLIAPK